MRGEKSAGAEAGKLIVNFKQTTNAIKRGAHRQNKKKCWKERKTEREIKLNVSRETTQKANSKCAEIAGVTFMFPPPKSVSHPLFLVFLDIPAFGIASLKSQIEA